MGLNLCKYSLHCICCFWLCKCCNRTPQNSVGLIPDKKIKLLLLGLSGSGKTEIAHYLSQNQRLDYDATNGVHNYCIKLMETSCSLTEIGGSDDMQKIWHHYFVTTMGVIYCFDMSSNYEDLKKAFKLLQNLLKNPYIMAKPILLVATKADLADDGIQLYDIENTFGVQKMAVSYSSSIRICYYDPRTANSEANTSTCLKSGIQWMIDYMLNNYNIIQMRLSCDKNMQDWENKRNKLVAEGKLNFNNYHRFPKKSNHTRFWRLSRKRLRRTMIRPNTAPSRISYINIVQQSATALTDTSSATKNYSSFKVPNGDVQVHSNKEDTDL